MTSVTEATKLLSTPVIEQETLPPETQATEGQEAPAAQEASPEAQTNELETLPPSDTETPPEMHKVKVDGEEIEVDYDELKRLFA